VARAGPELRNLRDSPAQIDRAGELKMKWGTETGQAWLIGPHRLICGDCRDEGTVRRLWADNGPKLRMVGGGTMRPVGRRSGARPPYPSELSRSAACRRGGRAGTQSDRAAPARGTFAADEDHGGLRLRAQPQGLSATDSGTGSR
jgi:hypothetical protein